MTNWKSLVGGVAVAAISTAIVQQAEAQVTTSSVRGSVVDANGAAVSGAAVTVTNTSTGVARTASTNSNGTFNVRGLSISGLYTVAVAADGYRASSVSDLALGLGKTTDLPFVLETDETRTLETVVITASAAPLAQVATGPSTVFNIDTLESAPTINRNIGDVLRIDPRVYVNEGRSGIDPIQCGGKNPRFNSFTLDGVRMNDGFGLNSNGYPTERQPFPFDAIEQVAVELAPFDVQYGGFTACNINAVTKSGGNEFHGSVFFDYTNEALKGDSLEGDNIEVPDFDEKRYGVQVSGPIVKDKLFFSVGYEKLEGVEIFERGVIGSGAINEVDVTQAELDEIIDIANTVYQYNPGVIPSSMDEEDEKIFAKLDWNISNNHRAALTYIYNDGFNIAQSDGDNNELEFSNHLYERGAELNQLVGFLYSDWTDSFSTEIRLGKVELDNRQVSIGGTDFGEFRVQLEDRDGLGDVDVYLGGDDSRQSNKLNYDILNLALKGFYNVGRHNMTFGYEREQYDIFNLFVQHTETEIRFDSIDAFRNQIGRTYYNNAPSQNPVDAAADWGYAVNTLYVQDEFQATPTLAVTYGLRYDFWQTDDAAPTNPDFLDTYGFSNGQNLDGASLVQPRVAITWEPKDNLTVRAGVGRYSGGDPNVWLSNTYSNNNVVQFGDNIRDLDLAAQTYALCEEGVPEGPGWCIPQVLVDSIATGEGSNFEINYLDPDFEIPSEWKFNIGAQWMPDLSVPGFMSFLGGEYAIDADLIWSQGENSAIWLRGDLEQTGTTEEGYPEFSSVREPSFVLTNTSDVANEALSISFNVAKDYDNGLNWQIGYAFNDAKDVSPMNSSVGFSNYVFRAFFDPQAEVLSTSDWNTRHRWTGLVSYEKEFIADYATTLSAFGFMRSGTPYSATFNGTINPFGFTPYLDFVDNTLRPGAERNEFESGWWGKVDLRIEQELPGIMSAHRTKAFVTIDNFTNLLNDEWGVLYEHSNLEPEDDIRPSRNGSASQYEVRVGLRYEF
ncbi:TonB-dependent receptor [Hirschia maritima]|uniref:TonB-dependent receptor n=1 Tax=Hirschia maritima TaxID=1121961 RepID=UPI00037529F8|nr:TonB-dependent receptor [Hirschia maritima]